MGRQTLVCLLRAGVAVTARTETCDAEQRASQVWCKLDLMDGAQKRILKFGATYNRRCC